MNISANTLHPPVGIQTSVRPPVRRQSALVSAAISAVIVYLGIALAVSLVYIKMSTRAADQLPNNVDVLMAGSSVITVPLLLYEIPPDQSVETVIRRNPIMEMPKFERLLASAGEPNLSVFNGSNIGQSIEETREFVEEIIAQNKHPRLIVIFVAPGSFVGVDAVEKHNDLEKIIVEWKHAIKGFHERIQSEILFLTSHIYWHCHLREPQAKSWDRCQSSYKGYYLNSLSKNKLEAIARILDICERHSIRTLVVSTPLAPRNRALISGFSYKEYARAMSTIVGSSSGPGFVDLGQSPKFIEPSDFFDPAHCNAKGGLKMFEMIAPTMVQAIR